MCKAPILHTTLKVKFKAQSDRWLEDTVDGVVDDGYKTLGKWLGHHTEVDDLVPETTVGSAADWVSWKSQTLKTQEAEWEKHGLETPGLQTHSDSDPILEAIGKQFKIFDFKPIFLLSKFCLIQFKLLTNMMKFPVIHSHSLLAWKEVIWKRSQGPFFFLVHSNRKIIYM